MACPRFSLWSLDSSLGEQSSPPAGGGRGGHPTDAVSAASGPKPREDLILSGKKTRNRAPPGGARPLTGPSPQFSTASHGSARDLCRTLKPGVGWARVGGCRGEAPGCGDHRAHTPCPRPSQFTQNFCPRPPCTLPIALRWGTASGLTARDGGVSLATSQRRAAPRGAPGGLPTP